MKLLEDCSASIIYSEGVTHGFPLVARPKMIVVKSLLDDAYFYKTEVLTERSIK